MLANFLPPISLLKMARRRRHVGWQVRGQMDRIQALAAEREDLARELERERAERGAAQAAAQQVGCVGTSGFPYRRFPIPLCPLPGLQRERAERGAAQAAPQQAGCVGERGFECSGEEGGG